MPLGSRHLQDVALLHEPGQHVGPGSPRPHGRWRMHLDRPGWGRDRCINRPVRRDSLHEFGQGSGGRRIGLLLGPFQQGEGGHLLAGRFRQQFGPPRHNFVVAGVLVGTQPRASSRPSSNCRCGTRGGCGEGPARCARRSRSGRQNPPTAGASVAEPGGARQPGQSADREAGRLGVKKLTRGRGGRGKPWPAARISPSAVADSPPSLPAPVADRPDAQPRITPGASRSSGRSDNPRTPDISNAANMRTFLLRSDNTARGALRNPWKSANILDQSRDAGKAAVFHKSYPSSLLRRNGTGESADS